MASPPPPPRDLFIGPAFPLPRMPDKYVSSEKSLGRNKLYLCTNFVRARVHANEKTNENATLFFSNGSLYTNFA